MQEQDEESGRTRETSGKRRKMGRARSAHFGDAWPLIEEAYHDNVREMETDRVLAGAAVLTIVFTLVGAAWYVGRTTAAPADIDALRAEMIDRIGDVDGDVRTLREDTNRQLNQIRDDMNRQFDRLYELVSGLRNDGISADD